MFEVPLLLVLDPRKQDALRQLVPKLMSQIRVVVLLSCSWKGSVMGGAARGFRLCLWRSFRQATGSFPTRDLSHCDPSLQRPASGASKWPHISVCSDPEIEVNLTTWNPNQSLERILEPPGPRSYNSSPAISTFQTGHVLLMILRSCTLRCYTALNTLILRVSLVQV